MATNLDPADGRDLVRLVDALTKLLARLGLSADPGTPIPPVNSGQPLPREQLVSLDQCAAMVHITRRALARYRGRGLPAPVRPGHAGRPTLYDWRVVRPWLEATFGLRLPECHPTAQHENLG